MPKVSIILPVYNGAEYLEESIQSVLKQTYQDFELIIIDDCSTDATGDIAQKYNREDDRVKYFRNDVNLKLPASLNRGFSLAQGKFFTWTSCDNAYKKNALKVMVEVLENEDDVALVYTSMDIIDEIGTITGFFEPGLPKDLIFRNVVGACFMYRSDVAKDIGDYDTETFLCEDYDYWLRISEKTKIYPILDSLYLYRRHSKSLTAQREQEIIAKGIAIQRKYYSRLIKTRRQAALFYANLRARDIYNPLRQLYLLKVFWYSPCVFFQELGGLIKRRFVS